MSVPDWFRGKSYDKKIFDSQIGENIPPYQYTIKITLPQWSLTDIDLIRWISAWGKEVKVISPQVLIDKIHSIGEGITHIYQDIELIFCGLEQINQLVKENKEKQRRRPLFIAIDAPNNQPQPDLVQEQINYHPKDLYLLKKDDLNPLNSATIHNAASFIKTAKQKSKSQQPQPCFIYSHSEITLTTQVAIAIYHTLKQDPQLSNFRISLTYL